MHPIQNDLLMPAINPAASAHDSLETLDTLDTPKEPVAKETTFKDVDSDSDEGAAAATLANSDVSPQNKDARQEQREEGSEPQQKQLQYPVYNGDGADPYQAQDLIAEETPLDWIAYAVSLNYTRLATSILYPITRWQWFDRIPNTRVILGAVPSQQLLAQLQKQEQVEDIINMCAEFSGHLETMRELGLRQCWIPTRDYTTPSLESIWIGVRYIEKCENRHSLCQSRENTSDQDQLSEEEEEQHGTSTVPGGAGEGGTIYLHCKAGRGRSATVALCWLVFAYKLTALEAQTILLTARGQVDKKVHLHPEVIAFDQEVQEQENQGSIVRKDWPGSLA